LTQIKIYDVMINRHQELTSTATSTIAAIVIPATASTVALVEGREYNNTVRLKMRERMGVKQVEINPTENSTAKRRCQLVDSPPPPPPLP
jgi:hypothetical protein